MIRRNVIFKRSKFNKRVHLENETVDSFVTDLHCMAEHCQFGDINDELISDRLVDSFRDTRLETTVRPTVDFGKSCKPD